MASILYLASTLERCGPVNQLYDLLANLDRGRFRPVVATLSPETAQSRSRDFEALGITTLCLGLSRVEGFLWARSAVSRLVEQYHIAIVHSQGIRGDILASQIHGPMRIATIHNYPRKDYARTYGVLKGSLMAHLHMRAARRLDAVVGVSRAVSHNLVDDFNVKSAQSIVNGVDVGALLPATREEKIGLRKGLELPSAATIWVSSGQFSQRKDPLAVIKAWQAAGGSGDQRYLLMLGNGPLHDTARALAATDQTIRLVGNVSNVREYLRAADIFVSASSAEGLPLAVLEAMACGLPLRLSDIAPHREVLDMDKTMGILFPLGNQKELIELIRGEEASSLEAAAKAARRMAESKFSSEAMANKYMALYSRLLGGDLI